MAATIHTIEDDMRERALSNRVPAPNCPLTDATPLDRIAYDAAEFLDAGRLPAGGRLTTLTLSDARRVAALRLIAHDQRVGRALAAAAEPWLEVA